MFIDNILEHVTFFKANVKFGRKTRFGTCCDLVSFRRF